MNLSEQLSYEIESSYQNAYDLMVGNTTYDELSEQALLNTEDGVFFLPANHTDAKVLLDYFESTQDFEKCARIANVSNTI